MKTIKLTHIFFTFLIYVSILFFFNGCSDSGNNGMDNSCETFLECFDGTVWEDKEGTVWEFDGGYEEFGIKWVKFNLNGVQPFDFYEDITADEGCYYILKYNNNDGYFILLENSKNILKIKYIPYHYDHYFLESFTYKDDVMLYKDEMFANDNNKIRKDLTVIFTKSNVDLEKQPICN